MNVASPVDARAVPGIDDLIIGIPIGDELAPLPEGDRYLGFIFASGDTPEAVEAALRTAHQCLEVEIEPVHGMTGIFKG